MAKEKKQIIPVQKHCFTCDTDRVVAIGLGDHPHKMTKYGRIDICPGCDGPLSDIKPQENSVGVI